MTDAEKIFQQLLDLRVAPDKRETFLHPSYTQHLYDPYLMNDMKKAVSRIKSAIKSKELITIYGDYDIDGLTATTVLYEALIAFGGKVEAYIPNRFSEGYGLSKSGLKTIADAGAKLVVTVDCGSISHKEVEYGNSLGLDIIITDHHTVGQTLPKAVAVLNPKRPDSTYPFGDLAGVGVAFKLVQALQKAMDGHPSTRFARSGLTNGLAIGQEKWLLDLVALGTVCDVVSLVDENRALVHYGLKVLSQTRRPGLRALASVSATDITSIRTDDLGFRFGPRLNASGRLKTAQLSLEVLQATSDIEALRVAQELDRMNHERRTEQARILAMALEQAETYQDDPVLVLSHPSWSHGIVGIVAAKISEQFHKPTFVLQEIGEESKGSARSFGDFSAVAAVRAAEAHIIRGGGHKFAAGCTLLTAKIGDFRRALNDFYRQSVTDDQTKHHKAPIDLELPSFRGIGAELLELLKVMEPFGNGNRRPLFHVPEVSVASWKPVGVDSKHAKLFLKDNEGAAHDAIGFGLSEKCQKLKDKAAISFELEANTYMGITKPQLRVVDIQ